MGVIFVGVVEDLDVVWFGFVVWFFDYYVYVESYDVDEDWEFGFFLDEGVIGLCVVNVVWSVVCFCDDWVECCLKECCVYFVGNLFEVFFENG